MFAYRGSTAMITGASKGLGAAFAKELAGRGMNLVLAARSIDTLQDLADSLGAQNGVRCVALQADLAASDAVKRQPMWVISPETGNRGRPSRSLKRSRRRCQPG